MIARAALFVMIALAGAIPAHATEVDLKFDQTIKLQETEATYGLELHLHPVSSTRIGADAVLDLRDLQRQLPELIAGKTVLDTCGFGVRLLEGEAEADAADVRINGRVNLDRFDCQRTDSQSWRRGELKKSLQIDFDAKATAELQGSCVVFRLNELQSQAVAELGRAENGTGRLANARDLMIEAVDLVLQEFPFCPKLPPELSVLEPRYDSGAPREIGDGGLGIAMSGSIDVSTATIIKVLRYLQNREVLPPAP